MRTLPLKIKLFELYFSMVVAFVHSASLVKLLAQSSTKSNNQIDQVLGDAVNEKKVPGIVAIVFVADKVTYQGAAGMRDSTKNIPMTVDSIFRIASMTKAITSVAVMQLVESGRVKLDEPAWTYLPELSEGQVLGMKDTFFDVPPEKQPRVVAIQHRQNDGSLVEPPQQPLKPARFFSGGAGLYSTAGDYLIFERMLLDGGKAGSKRLLKSETVEEMSRNQIGDLNLVDLRSSMPEVAKDPVRIQGLDKFGLGFAINTKPFEGGRSAGSLTCAGIYSTFFWIDPSRKTCAVVMLQILPFGDDITNTVVAQFERAVYANTAQTAVRSAN